MAFRIISPKRSGRYPSSLSYLQLKQSLQLWNHIRKICDKGNLLDEEYDEWKSLYPDFITAKLMYDFTPDPEIESRIAELNKSIKNDDPDNGTDNKPAKRPRKTRM